MRAFWIWIQLGSNDSFMKYEDILEGKMPLIMRKLFASKNPYAIKRTLWSKFVTMKYEEEMTRKKSIMKYE